MSITRIGIAALTLGLAVGIIGGASAQGFGGPMAFGSDTRSNPLGLLQRQDVQNELELDIKQKNALSALQDRSGAQLRNQIRTTMQGQNRQNARNMTPEQRQQQMQTMRAQMQAQMQAWQGELSEEVKKILRTEQITRLHELDLQRRGPLALGDPRIAEEIKLSAESRAATVKISGQYQQETSELMRQTFQEAAQSGALQRGERPDFENKLSPVRQKLDALKKTAEENIVAAITPDEKAAWKKAQGAPFTFRTDAPRRPQQNLRRNGGY